MADYFTTHNVQFIDYKDIEILKKFIDAHGRIINRRRSGLSAGHQRSVTQAIKRARFMGLLPFIMS
jgi:small subunit ribosomal protein S18